MGEKNYLIFSSDFEINSGHYIHEERIKTTKKNQCDKVRISGLQGKAAHLLCEKM